MYNSDRSNLENKHKYHFYTVHDHSNDYRTAIYRISVPSIRHRTDIFRNHNSRGTHNPNRTKLLTIRRKIQIKLETINKSKQENGQ